MVHSNQIKLQNQADRIITGALRSTPINRIESITGLQLKEDRRANRGLQQAEKFKRLTNHPMHQRIKGFERGRLKRTSFVVMAKGEIRKHEALASPVAVSLTANIPTSPWKRTELPDLICEIPGIVDKQLQKAIHRKCIAVEFINDSFN
jgi:hypothetical protein